MSRVADSTIKGFIYQFYKSIYVILTSNEEEITIEGVVEDIDIASGETFEAIQCKYHESIENFTPSKVYKPIAQMLLHFSKNRNQNINYRLYAYFPNEELGSKSIDIDFLNGVVSSGDIKIKKIMEQITINETLKNDFLEKFSFEIGKSLTELETDIVEKFRSSGMSEEEAEVFAFPKAIEIISKHSCRKNEEERKINKEKFLRNLKAAKETVLSRWVVELKSYEKILKTMKNQIKEGLKQNVRKRGVVFSEDAIERFDGGIINFIKSFVDNYYFKSAHSEPPLFCFFAEKNKVNNIKERLADKDIRFNDGLAGEKFVQKWFFKQPLLSFDNSQVREHEFRLRLLNGSRIQVLESHKLDDLYLVGEISLPEELNEDVIIYKTNVKDIKELEFLFNLRATYE